MTNNKILYHASQVKGLNVLKPSNQTPRFVGENDYIFATPFKEVAAMFLAPKGISSEIGKYGDVFTIFINGTLDEYKALDSGGSIYEVDGVQFTTDPTLGMGDTEWVCDHELVPISEEVYESSLVLLRSIGVKVYFVDNMTFEIIQKDPSNALDIVSKSS